ncbi:MAG: hypothetical protein LBR15_04095 [Methanobrevibacter sp.]|jgi:hypothetical protein|nr:hypothetical protein [Candidatus Methanovirga australis]
MNYEVLINDCFVYYFKLPFKLNEEQIKVACPIEIKLKYPLWANVWLNNECIYSFPILEHTDLTQFKTEVRLHNQ